MRIYPTDLTNNQWSTILKIILDKRKRKYDLRLIVNALFYISKSGCQWRMLPKCFPRWNLVYYYFRKWKEDGTFDLIMSVLRSKVRMKSNKNSEPTVGIIDSQSVKTSGCGEDIGYDGNKKIKGRKRHIVVDTLGLPLCVKVHSASIHDGKAAEDVLTRLKQDLFGIMRIIADGGYRGDLKDSIKNNLNYILQIVMRTDKKKGFVPLPKRWIVERTFAWLQNQRRLCKDYEYKVDSEEAMIKIATIALMCNRLSKI